MDWTKSENGFELPAPTALARGARRGRPPFWVPATSFIPTAAVAPQDRKSWPPDTCLQGCVRLRCSSES
jgi:hypothetical protein